MHTDAHTDVQPAHLAHVRDGVPDERKLEDRPLAQVARRVSDLGEHQPRVLLRAVHHVARHVRLARLVGVRQQRQVARLLGDQPILVQLAGAQEVEVAGEVQARVALQGGEKGEGRGCMSG